MDEDEEEDDDDEGEDEEESDTNDDELDTDMMDDRDSADDASNCKWYTLEILLPDIMLHILTLAKVHLRLVWHALSKHFRTVRVSTIPFAILPLPFFHYPPPCWPSG